MEKQLLLQLKTVATIWRMNQSVGVQLLGAAAQGYNQGMQQSAPSINAIPLSRTAHCHSVYSSFTKSADTTCTEY